MRHLISLALAVALMAACGSPDPGQNDSSTTRNDSGNPAVDASNQVDTPVGNDAPVPPVDRPVVMNDAGTPPVDVQTMSNPCWMELCGEVLRINMDGATARGYITCTPGVNQIYLSFLPCLGPCANDRCTCNIEGETGRTAIIANDGNSSICSPEFTVTIMQDGAPVSRTSGIVRIRSL